MADQQYIYVATPAVVAAPASYAGYTSYSQSAETAYVQPGYTAMVQVPEQTGATYVVPSYQYDGQLQFSQSAQQQAASATQQPEYGYAAPSAASGYAQQLTLQQGTTAYTQQTNQVVYGSQAHLAAVQQAAAGQQQAALAQSTSATQVAAYGQQQQQAIQQHLTMPLAYAQQQQQTSQPGVAQYAYQQTSTSYAPSAASAPPQSISALQPPSYGNTTLIAQQAGLAYAQQQQAAQQQQQQQQQPSIYNTQPPVNQTNQPPPSFTYQQQQQIAALQQQQQQQVATVVAAAYGQQPQQQTVFYSQQQQQPPVMPGPTQPQTMPYTSQQQQQQQQQQLFLPGPPGNVLGNPGAGGQLTMGLGGHPGVRPPLSLPRPSAPPGSNFMQFNHQQRLQGMPARGFGEREHHFGEDSSNHHLMGGAQQSSEMEIQRFPDTIFVQGLPEDATEEKLAQHFAAAGKLKMDTRTGKPRISIIKDKVTGRQRGEATIGFLDAESVQMAIKMFNNKDFHGRKIRIEMASRKVPVGQQPPQAIKRSRPGEDSADWVCPNPSCNNENFSWRTECNRCKGPRQLNDGHFKANPLRGRMEVPIRAMPTNRLGMGLNLGGPNMLRPNNLNSMAMASIRARLGGVGMGLGPLGGMPGGPIRGAIRGRMDRRGGRPY